MQHFRALPQDGTSTEVSCSNRAKLAKQDKNNILTVMPQKAAVFFPNLCRNHCHSGMLITAETWVNRFSVFYV